MISTFTSPSYVNRVQESWQPGYGVTQLSGAGGPTLYFDFMTGVLNPAITFTRASSATYFNSAGVLQTATTNTPRFDYNPSTLAAKGLLIEEQRVNQCIYSQDFTYANWLVTAGTKTTGVADPWGGTTAATITATNTAANLQNAMATVVIGTTYTVSIWMRRRTGTGSVGIRAVENVNTTVAITSTWARYSVTATATQTVGRCGVFVQTIGDEIDVWGAQLEAGAFPTSYIPTTTTAATRAADVASVDTLSPWFNASEGTLFAEGTVVNNIAGTTARAYAEIGNSSSGAERFVVEARATTSTRARIVVGGVSTNSSVNYNALDTNTKIAGAYGADGVTVCVAGLSPVTTATSVFGTVTSLFLGAAYTQTSATNINGYLRRITYYPRRLSNAKLQSLTS